MKLYADLPGRRTAQILADVGMLAWVCVWAWVGRFVHDSTMELAAPGRRLQSAGSGFRQQMTSAGDTVRDVPLVGDRIAAPFRQASGAGTSIEQAGTDLVDSVESDAPTMARSIARLERAGLVRRAPSPTDRRAIIVEATQASLALRAKVADAWAELERLTIGTLTHTQQAEILASLELLENILTRTGD